MLVQSLALPFLLGAVGALDLDVSSQDSIKSTAKTLASSIIATYKDTVKESLVPGLFAPPYYWWEAGTVFNGLIEYSHLTEDSQFNELVAEALLHQVGESNAFNPVNQTATAGNDDQAFWGLAAMTAAEVGFPKNKGNESVEWIDLANNVFNRQALRWNDTTCDGGLKWQIFSFNPGYSYRNTGSNGMFFLLAARLAQFTGNTTYSEWADKSFTWMQDVGLISDKFQVYDGTDDRTNCSEINHIQWTAYHGIVLEGAAVMYNMTSDDRWKNATAGLADSSSIFVRMDTKILQEVACEEQGKCNVDQKAFKGVAVRSWARAALQADFIAEDVTEILEASAKAAAKTCEGKDIDMTCNFQWTEDTEATPLQNGTWSVSEGGLGETFNVMEVVQALLYPQAKPNQNGTTTPSGTGATGGNSTATGAPEAGSAAGTTMVSWGTVLLAGAFAMFLS